MSNIHWFQTLFPVLCHYDFNVFGFLTADWSDETGNLKTQKTGILNLIIDSTLIMIILRLLQQYWTFSSVWFSYRTALCFLIYCPTWRIDSEDWNILRNLKKGLSPSKEEIMTASSTHFHYELKISLRSHPHCWLKQGFNHISISSEVWAALMDVTFSTSEEGMNCILQIHHNVLTCPTEQLWSL